MLHRASTFASRSRAMVSALGLVTTAGMSGSACGTTGPGASSDGVVSSSATSDQSGSTAFDDVDTTSSHDDSSAAAPPTAPCDPAPGTTGSPKTVLDVVSLVNGLPMPVTLPCFLHSLDRPLMLLATSSVVSAQPSQGQDNPRLFIISDHISLSVVTSGNHRDLLEIGEITAPNRSIKGEILFPVAEPLDANAAFQRIAQTAERTVCYGCHYPEEPAANYPGMGAFVSTAYRPIPRLEINFDYVEYQFTVCDDAADPERCAMLGALFDQGQVSRGEFPAEMPTFD